MSTPAISYTEDQNRIIQNRDTSMLVSASAGSGKTAVLVERICRLVVEDQVSIDQILAVTFTEDAAREIRDRVRRRLQEELERVTLDPESSKWSPQELENQLILLETAQISTIHGFCLNLIGQYYYLLGLPFSTVQNVETGVPVSQALEKAYLRARAQMDPEALSSLILYFRSFKRTEKDLQESILAALDVARSRPDPGKWIEESWKDPFSSWFYRWFSFRLELMQDLIDRAIERLQASGSSKAELEARHYASKREGLDELLQALEREDYEGFEKGFEHWLKTSQKMRKSAGGVDLDDLKKAQWELEKEVAAHLLEKKDFARIHEVLTPVARAFIELASRTEEYFIEEKRKAGFIDFSDMEQLAATLLGQKAAADEVADRFRAVFIDEFQDTNDLQDYILRQASKKSTTFRVGDIKQSIYGFRQARPALMRALMEDTGGSHETLFLRENFRSRPRLIAFNNLLYQQLMNDELIGKQFAAEDVALPGRLFAGDDQGSIRFLYTEYENFVDENGNEPGERKARSLHREHRYDLIARDIREQVAKGKSYGDFAILTRASTNHEKILEALQAYDIPAVSRSRRGFYTNPAVQIVISTLRAIQDPRDDIALMAFLTSPLGGSSQAEIARALKEKHGSGSLYEDLRMNRKIMHNYRRLEALRDLPPAAALEKLYVFNNFYASAISAQDRVNLDLLLQKGVQAQDYMDLDEFLAQSELEAALDKTGEASPLSRNENAVRVSTIHASKGLQYSHVYLLTGDTGRDETAGDPILIDDELGLGLAGLDHTRRYTFASASRMGIRMRKDLEEIREKMRLLYVATTRAEDELVFVDTFPSREKLSMALSPWTLFDRKAYTDWLLPLFPEGEETDLEFEEKEYLLRDAGKKPRSFYRPVKVYDSQSHPVRSFSSQIASAAEKSTWPVLSLDQPSRKMRGTLFHELAAALPFPYERKTLQEYAGNYGADLDESDIDQILSLGKDPYFARWMQEDHQFEYPYAAMIPGEGNSEQVVHGFMDFVCFEGDTIHIVDFKTDLRPDDQLVQTYRGQLQTYRKAMERIFPGRRIDAWIYSFTGRKMLPVD